MVGAELSQLALAVCDLALELVDETQAGLDRPLPRLWQAQPGEQLAPADAEQIGDRTGPAVGEQHRVHTLLEAGAVAHEVQPPTCPFALSTLRWLGHPDR